MGDYNLSDRQKEVLRQIVNAYKRKELNGWGLFIQQSSVSNYGYDSYIDWGKFKIDIEDEMDFEELVYQGLLSERINKRGARQVRLTNQGINAVDNKFIFEDMGGRMTYNLTDRQKELLKLLVEGSREKNWGEAFLDMSSASDFTLLSLGKNGTEIPLEYEARFDMGAIVRTGLIIEDNKTYTLTQAAYEAVDNDFIMSDVSPHQIITTTYVGTQIQGNVSGGNVQGIAYANDSIIQQIINDPEMLAAELEKITSDLLDAVKNVLDGKQLMEYSKIIDELNNELRKEQPDQSVFRKIVSGLSFLNDTTSSIDLILKALPYIGLLLQLANQVFS